MALGGLFPYPSKWRIRKTDVDDEADGSTTIALEEGDRGRGEA